MNIRRSDWILCGVVLCMSLVGCVQVKRSEIVSEIPQVVWSIDFDFLDRGDRADVQCFYSDSRKKLSKHSTDGSKSRALSRPVRSSSQVLDRIIPKIYPSLSQIQSAMETSVVGSGVAVTRLRLLGEYKFLRLSVLRADIRRIKELYRNYGFFRTQVFFDSAKDLMVLARRSSYRDYQRVSIRLRICEGPQVIVRDLSIKWHPDKPKVSGLLDNAPLRLNGRYTTTGYRETLDRIVLALQSNGYALAKIIDRQVVISRNRRWASIRFVVHRGPPCIFGGIEVHPDRESGKISQEVISRFVRYDLREGQAYRLQTLARVQSSLFALGVFRTVSVRPRLPEIADPARVLSVPVVIEVREDRFQLIKLGFGFVIDGQRHQVEGSIGWNFANFLGGMRELDLQFRPGWAFLPDIFRQFDMGPEITASATFKQPIYMDRKAELGLRVLYRRAEEIGSADFQTLTPSVWFSRPIWGTLSGRIGYNIELAFDVQNPLTLERENYILSYLEQELVWDLRDNKMLTRRGIYANMLFQQAFGGTFTYFKALTEFRFYIPLPLQAVLAGRISYGIMFSMRNGEPNADHNAYSLVHLLRQSPLTQRFFSGGANSVRGWTARYLGPLACRIERKHRETLFQEDEILLGGEKYRVVRAVQQNVTKTEPVTTQGHQSTASELVDKMLWIGERCRVAAVNAIHSRTRDLEDRRSALPSDNRPGISIAAQEQTLQVVPIGGHQMYEISLELRIPLTFISESLRLAFFVDAGAMQIKPQLIDPRELMPSISVGGGIRFDIARIGTLRLDVAGRIAPDHDRYPLQQGWQIHFSFGEAF